MSEETKKTRSERRKERKSQPAVLDRQPSLLKDILSTALTLVLMVGFVYFFLTCVGQRVAVDGTSMTETLQDRDQLIVDCFTYRFVRDPKRFEIVVIRLKNDPGTYYVKRVIGLPGETVQIINARVYINGQMLDDPYARPHCPSGIAAEPITLGEDEYFVLGDNRGNSVDSRSESLGPVKLSQFVGRAVYRILPYSTRTSLIPDEVN